MMYAIRIRSTHEAVGIFFTDEFAELSAIVDEVTDPYQCEAKLVRGGIMWPKQTEIKFPLEDECPDFGGAEISEVLVMDLINDRGWRALPHPVYRTA